MMPSYYKINCILQCTFLHYHKGHFNIGQGTEENQTVKSRVNVPARECTKADKRNDSKKTTNWTALLQICTLLLL